MYYDGNTSRYMYIDLQIFYTEIGLKNIYYKSIYYCRVTTIWRVWLKHLWNKQLPRAYEKGFSRYICPGPGEPRRGPWISKGAHSRSQWRFILMFSYLFFLIFFNSNPQFWEKFQSVPGAPKQSCSALQNFLGGPAITTYALCAIIRNHADFQYSKLTSSFTRQKSSFNPSCPLTS